MVSKRRVLVTGASGLIGGLVIKNLGDKYEFSALNRRPIEGIASIQADISNFDAIHPAFEGIDTVLHLGALATPGLTNNWDGIVSTNIHGTFNVYEASRISGVKRIVFASSGGTIQGYERDPEYKSLVDGDESRLTFHKFAMDESEAKEVMNFQISMTIFLLISGILCFILIGIPFVIGLGIFNVIITIIAGIKANDGKSYRYPINLRLIK